MAGYDPKQKRAHSPAAEEHAPVDDLLGPPPAAVAEPAPSPRVQAPDAQRPLIPTPAPAPSREGPDPKVLVIAAAAVAAVLVWRWRRR